MEILKQPDNHELYERHKEQARIRTRRYRAKQRQQKLIESLQHHAAKRRQQNSQSPEAEAPGNSFPLLQFAGVKLEEVSDSEGFVN